MAAALAFAIDRGLPVRSGLEPEEAATPDPDPGSRDTVGSRGEAAPLARAWVWPNRLAFWGTAVSGMCALASEAPDPRPRQRRHPRRARISLMRLERFDEATPQFERAVALRPDHRPSHYGLATALDQSGQLSEAIASLERALELNPDDARMRERMARLQSRRAER